MNCHTIRDQVLDAFDTFNLLMVFATVLFGLKYREITECLGEEIPAGRQDVFRLERRTVVVLWTTSVPPAVIAVSTVLLFLPLTLEVANAYRLALWNFDPVVTGFVFVEVLMMLFAIWSLVLVAQVCRKVRMVRRKRTNQAA